MNKQLIKRIDEWLNYELPDDLVELLQDCRAELARKYVPMTDDERNEMITVYTTPPSIDALIADAVAKEREACAKLCEETTAAWTEHLYNDACVDCAEAIRARGQR